MNVLLNKLLSIYECPTCFGATELSEGDCERCRSAGVNYAKLTKTPKPTGASFAYVTPVGAEHYSADSYHRTGERFAEAMRREFPVDLTISTTCPRCSATIDPAAVEQHHERCFVAGDWVRLDMGKRHLTGEVRLVERDVLTVIPNVMHGAWYVGEIGQPFTIRIADNSPRNLRHIQRPGQAVVSGCAFIHGESDRIAAVPVGSYRTPHVLSVKVTTPEPNCTINGVPAHCPPPAPTLYDGLTAEQCLELWQRRQREATNSQFMTITSAQLAAARDLWQQQLRARISAAKERERLTVMMPIDVEDIPWR